MANKAQKVVVGGKTFDFDKLEDAAQLQAILLPDNWPVAKREGVRLFLNLKEMVTHEFQRHFAHNFAKVVKTAIEQQAEGEDATVAVGFAFEVNLSALTVAALGKTKMSFSHKFSTEGKPKSHDINQSDFYADLGEALDTAALDEEMKPEEKPEKPAKEKKSKKAPKKDEVAE
jgi:hypothetical protein